MPDDLDDLGTAVCPACGELMQPAGDVREVATDDGLVTVGTAYWQCPRDGVVRLV